MGDIVIAGVYAADQTFQKLITANIICAGFDQSGLIGNIKSELSLLFNANNVTGLFLYGFPYHVHQALGLSASLQTHKNANHSDHSLSIFRRLPILYKNSVPFFPGTSKM